MTDLLPSSLLVLRADTSPVSFREILLQYPERGKPAIGQVFRTYNGLHGMFCVPMYGFYGGACLPADGTSTRSLLQALRQHAAWAMPVRLLLPAPLTHGWKPKGAGRDLLAKRQPTIADNALIYCP